MGTLRDILATRHGIDITEQQEQLLFDEKANRARPTGALPRSAPGGHILRRFGLCYWISSAT